jgi:hypothetical protein
MWDFKTASLFMPSEKNMDESFAVSGIMLIFAVLKQHAN